MVNGKRARSLRRVFGVKHVHQIPVHLRSIQVPIWAANKYEIMRRAEAGTL